MKKDQKKLVCKQLVDQLTHKSIDLPKDQSAPLMDVVSPNFLQGSIYERVQKYDVPSNFNSITLPTVSSATGLVGGLTFSIVDSGDSIPLTKTVIKALKLELSKVAAIIPITSELDEDTAEFLYPFLQTNISKSLKYALDMLVLYGDPSTSKFTGICDSAAPSTGVVDVAVANTLQLQVRDMVDKYYGGYDGKFYVSRTTYNDILELVDSATSDTIQVQGDKLYIYNYEVEVSNVMGADEMILGDFSQYAIAQKDFRQDISDSLYFLTDQKAVKYTFRAGGNSIWDGGLTQEDTTEVFPFVVLSTMVSA